MHCYTCGILNDLPEECKRCVLLKPMVSNALHDVYYCGRYVEHGETGGSCLFFDDGTNVHY